MQILEKEMFDKLLLGYVYKKIENIDTPAFNRDLCINNSQKKFNCNACSKLCSSGALVIEGKNRVPSFNIEKCTGCKLCSQFCQSEALKTNNQYLPFIKRKNEGVLFSCNENKAQINGEKVSCIASIPFYIYAYMSIENNLMIDKSICSSCDKTKKEKVEKLIEKINLFIGDDVSIIEEDKITQKLEKIVSRREFFTSFKTEIVSSVNTILPENKDESRYIKDELKSLVAKSGKIYKMNSFHFNENCNGCKNCLKLCPKSAIDIKYLKEKAIISHNPFLCIECQNCINVCCTGGIEKTIVDISFENLYSTSEIKTNLCSECLLPLPFTYLKNKCPTCLNKKEKRKLSVNYKEKTRPIL